MTVPDVRRWVEYPGPGRSGDGDGQDISITRQLIDTALDELRVERKARLGFQVA